MSAAETGGETSQSITRNVNNFSGQSTGCRAVGTADTGASICSARGASIVRLSVAAMLFLPSARADAIPLEIVRIREREWSEDHQFKKANHCEVKIANPVDLQRPPLTGRQLSLIIVASATRCWQRRVEKLRHARHKVFNRWFAKKCRFIRDWTANWTNSARATVFSSNELLSTN